MVADGDDEANDDESEVGVVEDDVGDAYIGEVEGGVFHRFRKNEEGDVVVSLRRCLKNRKMGRGGRGLYESKPRSKESKPQIQHLHLNEKLPDNCMAAPIQIIKVKRRMKGCEEVAVNLLSPLQDQLGNLVGHVLFCGGRFHVVQDPGTPSLGDDLPA